MKEYIEREEAVRAAKNGADEWDGGCSRYRDASIESAMNDIPAADVVEVKHGRWIYNNMGGWKCSECNNQAPFWCMASTQNLSDYCPNCGAKMDKADNDEEIYEEYEWEDPVEVDE